MSLKNPNIVSPARRKRVAIVIANPAVSTATGWPVGFWCSELTHPYYAFHEAGYDAEVFSPAGGRCDADAMSDPSDPSGYSASDLISQGFIHTPALRALVEDTKPVTAIDVAAFDAIVVAGGQAPMFTFERATSLHQKFAEFYQAGKIASALCHGAAILAYAKRSDGGYIAKDKTVTGFANIEEDFADHAVWEYGMLPRGTHIMPWQGLSGAVVGSIDCNALDFVRLGGSAADGVWTSHSFWPDNPDPKVQRFMKRAKEISGGKEADLTTARYYDCAMINYDLIKRMGVTNRPEDLDLDREKMRKGWETLKDFPGVEGKITMNKDGDGEKSAYIFIIKGGKYQRVQ